MDNEKVPTKTALKMTGGDVAGASMPNENTLIFSPSYDTLIELADPGSDATRTLRVYSGALKNASPVWRKILQPENGYSPPKPKQDHRTGEYMPLIHLEDISVEAATVFFNILHHNLGSVPRELPQDVVRDITRLVDEYDCRNSVLLWAEHWLNALARVWATEPEGSGFQDWLFIGNVFNGINVCHQSMRKIMIRLIKTTNQFGDSLEKVRIGDSAEEIDMTMIPQRLIAHIRTERERVLQSIVGTARELIIDTMSRSLDSVRTALPVTTCRNQRCLDLIIGSLHRCLRNNAIEFLGYDGDIPDHVTIDGLVTAIDAIHITTIIQHKVGDWRNIDHASLDPPSLTDPHEIWISPSQQLGTHRDRAGICPTHREYQKLHTDTHKIAGSIVAFPWEK